MDLLILVRVNLDNVQEMPVHNGKSALQMALDNGHGYVVASLREKFPLFRTRLEEARLEEERRIEEEARLEEERRTIRRGTSN